jgi:2-hydroxy-3-keto-5-methylthiopentenyl-1-phosphate phosphatase
LRERHLQMPVADGFGRPLTLLVGDGRSDFCLAGQADLVFAKKSLIGHCHDNALPHHPFSDFSEAVGLLEELLASPVTSGAQNQLKDMIDG